MMELIPLEQRLNSEIIGRAFKERIKTLNKCARNTTMQLGRKPMGLLLIRCATVIGACQSSTQRAPSSPTQTQAAPESSGDGTSSPPQEPPGYPGDGTLPPLHRHLRN